jgi:hypothetical protein
MSREHKNSNCRDHAMLGRQKRWIIAVALSLLPLNAWAAGPTEQGAGDVGVAPKNGRAQISPPNSEEMPERPNRPPPPRRLQGDPGTNPCNTYPNLPGCL